MIGLSERLDDVVVSKEEMQVRLDLDALARNCAYHAVNGTVRVYESRAFALVNSIDSFNRQGMIKFYYAKLKQYEDIKRTMEGLE